ncbi:MAG TPA: HDOD domain-containing protein [Gammaproteobacteria bacterium]|nr:HDOD domain-containing protein [Gammaproteobacteria bacterium]
MNNDLLHLIRTLPPLPGLAREILVAVTREDADFGSMAEKIAREPVIAARVVGIANSAFSRALPPALSIEGAIIRLGLNRVRMLALSVMLAEQFDSGRCPGFQGEHYWYQAVGTANCATQLARALPDLDLDAAYLGGLLHNIGLLLLAWAYPRQISQILSEQQATEPTRSLSSLLQAHLGTDHHAAGQQLLTDWGLPAEIIAATTVGADVAAEDQPTPLVQVIRYSAQWTAADYQQLPTDSLPGLAPTQLRIIAESCRGSREQLLEFARLLAHPYI